MNNIKFRKIDFKIFTQNLFLNSKIMSCLFNSLSYFVHIESYTLRQKICDYLQQNTILFDNLNCEQVIQLETGHSLNNYVNKMRSVSTWGGAIEIIVFCKLFNVRVNVKVKNTNDIIEFIPNELKDIPIYSIHWSGGHYEPIRK